jgi:TetR/AcrR family fatty acid metabolism transcriptional regulator
MLEAAGKLFGARRFHEVRMEDIAAEAQVGKGTLYRYFQDKEELYLALLAQASRQFVHCLQEALDSVEEPLAQLEALVAAILAFFDDRPYLLDLIQRSEVLQRSGREFPWKQTRHDVLRLLRDLFAEAQARGAFAVADVELSMLMLMGGIRSVIRLGPRPRPRDLARRIVAAFLQGATLTAPCLFEMNHHA